MNTNYDKNLIMTFNHPIWSTPKLAALKKRLDDARNIFVLRTPAVGCASCTFHTLHTAEERKLFHPLAGTGFRKEMSRQ